MKMTGMTMAAVLAAGAAFAAGETLRFIRGLTLENGPELKVKAVEVIDPKEIVIPVEAVSVGQSLAIGGFPGEPFTWMGTETKRRSPFLMTVPSCCDGLEGVT